jgi:hypothetical protein
MPKNSDYPTRQEIEQGEAARRRFEEDIITRQSNVLPLDAARNEGRFYGKLIRGERPLSGVQRAGFFLVGSLFCGMALFLVVDAFPGLLRFMDLHAVPMGDKSVAIVSLPFASLFFLLGFKLIRSAIVVRSRRS